VKRTLGDLVLDGQRAAAVHRPIAPRLSHDFVFNGGPGELGRSYVALADAEILAEVARGVLDAGPEVRRRLFARRDGSSLRTLIAAWGKAERLKPGVAEFLVAPLGAWPGEPGYVDPGRPAP